ncbi:hypothetical protein B9479_002778 [Cryptococcus floricola]|uniref:Uncharacterized protein n=1 Tax=Cryptococcus floricola TaxID=2591691 RepID=A0A5D3B1V6_9TREE|nr:hypothetical protein B9479_002778 [Cryptococcus floricola]
MSAKTLLALRLALGGGGGEKFDYLKEGLDFYETWVRYVLPAKHQAHLQPPPRPPRAKRKANRVVADLTEKEKETIRKKRAINQRVKDRKSGMKGEHLALRKAGGTINPNSKQQNARKTGSQWRYVYKDATIALWKKKGREEKKPGFVLENLVSEMAQKLLPRFRDARARDIGSSIEIVKLNATEPTYVALLEEVEILLATEPSPSPASSPEPSSSPSRRFSPSPEPLLYKGKGKARAATPLPESENSSFMELLAEDDDEGWQPYAKEDWPQAESPRSQPEASTSRAALRQRSSSPLTPPPTSPLVSLSRPLAISDQGKGKARAVDPRPDASSAPGPRQPSAPTPRLSPSPLLTLPRTNRGLLRRQLRIESESGEEDVSGGVAAQGTVEEGPTFLGVGLPASVIVFCELALGKRIDCSCLAFAFSS